MLLKFLTKLLLKFMDTDAWKYISTKFIGENTIRLSGYPKFPMEHYHFLNNNILIPETGVIYTFASTDSMSLASILVRYIVGKGNFSHAGLILVSDENPPKILHMKGEGLLTWDLLTLLKEIDFLCVNRIKLNPKNYLIAKSRIDYLIANRSRLKYDFAQKMGNGMDKFYCSEANFFVLDGLTDDPDMTPDMMYGIKTFSPDKVTKIGTIAYTNHPKLI